MNILGVVLGTFGTLFGYLVSIFLLQKVYTISKDLAEIRDILKDFKRERDMEHLLAGGRPDTPDTWVDDIAAESR
jgi:hypothetical protein